MHMYVCICIHMGIPRWFSSRESDCQCRRHRKCGFDLWVSKIPWRRKWQPTPIFLPGESQGQRIPAGYGPWNCRVGHNWARMYSAKSLQSCPTLCDPIDGSHQAPLSLGFSRQEYWSELPFLPPRDLPNMWIKAACLASSGLASRFFTTSATWEALLSSLES